MQQVGQEYKIFVLASNIVISPAFSSNLQGQMSRKVRELYWLNVDTSRPKSG